MAERGKYRVAPVPAPTKKQYAYVPCPRSEEVGTEFALQLIKGQPQHHEPDSPVKPPTVLGLILPGGAAPVPGTMTQKVSSSPVASTMALTGADETVKVSSAPL